MAPSDRRPAKKIKRDPDLLDDYDFSKGVRGKYAKRYAEGTNVVVLAPDLAAVFPVPVLAAGNYFPGVFKCM